MWGSLRFENLPFLANPLPKWGCQGEERQKKSRWRFCLEKKGGGCSERRFQGVEATSSIRNKGVG